FPLLAVITVGTFALLCFCVAGCRSYPWSPQNAGKENSALTPLLSAEKNTNTVARSKSKGGKPNDKQAEADYAAQLVKARTLERSGKLDAAREIYKQLIVQSPERYEAYHRLAVVCDRQQRYLEAEALYMQAIRLNPTNPDLFNDLGYCYLLQGKFDKAERAILKAVGLSPANERYRNNLGLVYGYQGRYDAALEQFRRGGSEPDAWYNLAYVQWVRDDIELSVRSLERALAVNPSHAAARESLARITTGKSFSTEIAATTEYTRPHESLPMTDDAGALASDSLSDRSVRTEGVAQTGYHTPAGSLRLGMKERPSAQTQLDVARSSWSRRIQDQATTGQ
ncbi:MAG: tetratricopeptide repeat protein, partial [Candidatus Methanomethylicaceae archaeon]